MMFRCSFFLCFMPWRSFWIVFDCIKVDFKDETRGETPPVLLLFLFCNYRLVFFMYAVKVCVYLNMLRVPKISSKPNEVSVTLSSTTSATIWSTPIQNDSVFCWPPLPPRGGQNKTSLTFTASTKKSRFQSISLPLPPPPPSQQNVKYLSDSVLIFILFFSSFLIV